MPPLFHGRKAVKVTRLHLQTDIPIKAGLLHLAADVEQADPGAFPGPDHFRMHALELPWRIPIRETLFRVQCHVPHAQEWGDADTAADEQAIPFSSQKPGAEQPVRTVNSHRITGLEPAQALGVIADLLDAQLELRFKVGTTWNPESDSDPAAGPRPKTRDGPE